MNEAIVLQGHPSPKIRRSGLPQENGPEKRFEPMLMRRRPQVPGLVNDLWRQGRVN
jgi:hypothetical protein